MANATEPNIGIIAHVDAGKTTVSERILYVTGAIHRTGEVHLGTATMDYDPQERARGITINSAATTVAWRSHQINLIDTPGHIDFNIEVNRSLRVLDGAVVVFDGVAGVEPQTETNWRLADQYGVPRIALINKLDRTGADFARVVAMMAERLGARPLVMQLPIGQEAGFEGVMDLVTMQALRWPRNAQDQAELVHEAIPEAMQQAAHAAREALVDAAVEQDDAVLAAYLDGQPVSDAQLRACIRLGTLRHAFVPVFAGSALKNKGIEPLLDAVIDYLPAPEDRANALVEGDEGDPGRTVAQLLRYLGAIAPGMTLLALMQESDPALMALAHQEERKRTRLPSEQALKELDF